MAKSQIKDQEYIINATAQAVSLGVIWALVSPLPPPGSCSGQVRLNTSRTFQCFQIVSSYQHKCSRQAPFAFNYSTWVNRVLSIKSLYLVFLKLHCLNKVSFLLVLRPDSVSQWSVFIAKFKEFYESFK